MTWSLLARAVSIVLLASASACGGGQADAKAPLGKSGEPPQRKRTAPDNDVSPGQVLLSERVKERCQWTSPEADTSDSDFNNALLNVHGMRVLDRVATCLQGPLVGAGLTLVASTDDRGTGSYNQYLGSARSRTVRDYLVFRGVSASRLAVASRDDAATDQAAATTEHIRNVELDLAPSP